ncbi:hypothetical protein [Paremcibacter congregatus]|uniref:hypothetical protein n=1 Tax=Paremcibacter congregatus TaxID=2043170 RepID=UPI0030ECB8F7
MRDNFLYDSLMKKQWIIGLIFSFCFAQLSCAMSEGYEINLETLEHHAGVMETHPDHLQTADESHEHEKSLPGEAHCVPSHPQVSFILSASLNSFTPYLVLHEPEPDHNLVAIAHRPAVEPPRS